MNDEEIIRKLNGIFSDKKVIIALLTKEHRTLYSAIRKAKFLTEFKSISEYLKNLGFEVIVGNKIYTLEEIEAELLKLYPNKIIKSIPNKIRDLLNTRRKATETFEEYILRIFPEFKIEFSTNFMMEKEEILNRLNEIFPDKKIILTKLLREHNRLYEAIRKDKDRKEVSDYLRDLGFEVENRLKYSLEEVRNELLKIYPDGVINKIPTKIKELINTRRDKDETYENYILKVFPEFKVKSRVSQVKEEIIKKLDEIFEDRKVIISVLIKEHKNFYGRINREKRKGMYDSMSDYLYKLGFDVGYQKK